VSVSFVESMVEGRHGPIPIRTYTPERAPARGRTPLVWLHGGAFAFGGLDQLESHAPAMSVAAGGRTVVAVDYHLVGRWSPLRDPKESSLTGVRFPVPLEDVLDVVAAIARDRGDGRVLLGGASAGACLAAAAALDLVRHGDGSVEGLLLAYGTFHAELPPIPAELRSRIRGIHGITQFRPATVRRMNLNYAGSRSAMADPRAFPGGHDLAGLPDTILLDSDRDSLRASGSAFAEELRAAGVAVTYEVIAGSTHGFLNRPDTPAYAAGIERMLAWLAIR
jgi:acetyl esterase